MHMWDPNLAPGSNDLALVRDTVKRNGLGLMVEDDQPQAVEPQRLQMAPEDKWYAPPDASAEVAEQLAQKLEQEHRLKTAQLIKQQRLRIASLGQQNEEALAKYRLSAEEQARSLQEQIQGLQQNLRQQEELNADLKRQLLTQTDGFQKSREEMSQQLRALERHGRTEVDILRSQFDSEMQAKIAAAVMDYKEQIAIRDVELAYRNELDAQLQQEIDRLKQEREQLVNQGGDQILERLARLGVVFVVYHPGAGHLTIPLQDVARYQDNPLAYAASKCFVSEAQYRQWLTHYQQPTCEATLPSGERCSMPIDRVDSPSRFVAGDSNCCARHKASSRLRTVS